MMTTVHVVQRCLKPLAVLLLTLPLTAQGQVRILQSNAAGDRVHIIDPVTNKVVGEILGVEAVHGVTASPDGSRVYVSSEADDTLDVADVKTLKVIKKIPLSGRPNNIAISPDGRRVYVGIRQAVGNNPGVADVIDTASLSKVKSIRTEGPVHNLYVTPDGKHVVAGDASENGYVSVRYSSRSVTITGLWWWISRLIRKSLGSHSPSCPPGEFRSRQAPLNLTAWPSPLIKGLSWSAAG
jgi:YVTN family beta-propeller protein